jgi:hypothetical protein
MKYSKELKQKQLAMAERERKLIKEKEDAAFVVREKIKEVENNENNELKILKLKRQLQVLEDFIAAHQGNIRKIQQR